LPTCPLASQACSSHRGSQPALRHLACIPHTPSTHNHLNLCSEAGTQKPALRTQQKARPELFTSGAFSRATFHPNQPPTTATTWLAAKRFRLFAACTQGSHLPRAAPCWPVHRLVRRMPKGHPRTTLTKDNGSTNTKPVRTSRNQPVRTKQTVLACCEACKHLAAHTRSKCSTTRLRVVATRRDHKVLVCNVAESCSIALHCPLLGKVPKDHTQTQAPSHKRNQR
jgi:hypothetical protein